MNRLEQIKEWAQQREAELSSHYQAFVLGATVADQNPNHEAFNTRLKLEKKQWLEKAVKWLTENAFRYVVTRTYNEVKVTGLHTSMIEDFKKYMEDK